jgi:hypothetical protein
VSLSYARYATTSPISSSFKSSHVIPALIRKFHLANLLSKGDFDSIVHDFQKNGDDEAVINNSKYFISKTSSKDDVLMVLRRYGVYINENVNTNSELRTLNSELRVAVEVWGTGNATREFFYVEDAAEAIALATEQYNSSEPVNIGAGFEISIRNLVDHIVRLMDYRGAVVCMGQYKTRWAAKTHARHLTGIQGIWFQSQNWI